MFIIVFIYLNLGFKLAILVMLMTFLKIIYNLMFKKKDMIIDDENKISFEVI
jgi:hypothetical protein